MQANDTVPKLNPGAMAIFELLTVRSVLHDWTTPPDEAWSEDITNDPERLQRYNNSVFFSNIAGTVERGLPQFKLPDFSDITGDTEESRVCTVNELFDLARDLVEAGDMTAKRADTLNQAFENLTGHTTLVDWIQPEVMQ